MDELFDKVKPVLYKSIEDMKEQYVKEYIQYVGSKYNQRNYYDEFVAKGGTSVRPSQGPPTGPLVGQSQGSSNKKSQDNTTKEPTCCKYIFKRGSNINQQCTARVKGSDYCSKHKKCVHIEEVKEEPSIKYDIKEDLKFLSEEDSIEYSDEELGFNDELRYDNSSVCSDDGEDVI